MSGRTDDRMARRRAQVRASNRSERLRRSVSVLVLISVLVAGWAAERSWLVALDEIQLSGTARLEPQVVLAAADLALGTSTLRLRLGAAKARIEDLPLVAYAEVSRVSPVTVRIEVVERIPQIVGRSGTAAVLIDAEGIVIAAGDDPALTSVDVTGPLPSVGTMLGADSALGAANLVWQGLSGPLRAEVRRIEARSAQDIDLRLEDGTRVRIGRPDQLAEKVRSLGALLEELAGERVAVIDVRAPSNPVVSGRDRS
ncbi:MAG: cell division protein FtsQ [Glaciecola sp.]|jgi:cell division protein FtsQ